MKEPRPDPVPPAMEWQTRNPSSDSEPEGGTAEAVPQARGMHPPRLRVPKKDVWEGSEGSGLRCASTRANRASTRGDGWGHARAEDGGCTPASGQSRAVHSPNKKSPPLYTRKEAATPNRNTGPLPAARVP